MAGFYSIICINLKTRPGRPEVTGQGVKKCKPPRLAEIDFAICINLKIQTEMAGISSLYTPRQVNSSQSGRIFRLIQIKEEIPAKAGFYETTLNQIAK